MSVADVLDLVLPAPCPGCGRGSRAAGGCDTCRATLAQAAPSRRPLPVGGGQQVAAVAAYAGPARALLVARKERAARGLDPLLGRALATAVAVAVAGCAGVPPPDRARLALVPVPSRRAALRRRGEDTVGALASAAARVLVEAGVDVTVLPLLRHVRPVADSAGLDAAARFRNLDGALCADPRSVEPTAGRVVVVVDDLSTTGTTLAEACRALVRSGVHPSAAAVVALVAAPQPAAPLRGSRGTRVHGEGAGRVRGPWPGEAREG